MVIISVVMFIMTVILSRIEKEHDGVDDGGLVSYYFHKYWRSFQSVHGFVWSGLMISVWFQIYNTFLGKVISFLVLVLVFLTLFMLVVNSLKQICTLLFDCGEFDRLVCWVREGLEEWCYDFKTDYSDTLLSLFVKMGSFVLLMLFLISCFVIMFSE